MDGSERDARMLKLYPVVNDYLTRMASQWKKYYQTIQTWDKSTFGLSSFNGGIVGLALSVAAATAVVIWGIVFGKYRVINHSIFGAGNFAES